VANFAIFSEISHQLILEAVSSTKAPENPAYKTSTISRKASDFVVSLEGHDPRGALQMIDRDGAELTLSLYFNDLAVQIT
jgi:hypothetical protein